jgi:hypothetical protein
MTDAFYTPEPVARKMVDLLLGTGSGFETAADFAIGGGALLDQLSQHDPDSRLFGTDIDNRAVRSLRSRRPEWNLGCCDFLSTSSRRRCAVTRDVPSFDAIALNPPFSYRGLKRHTLELDGLQFNASPAASFVGLATRFTHNRTQIAALLPKSSLTSEKDASVWDHLRATWTIRVVEEFAPGWIQGSRTAVVLAGLSRKRSDDSMLGQGGEVPSAPLPRILVRLVRGTAPMHLAGRGTLDRRMIHTTGLLREGLAFSRGRGGRGRSTSGPSVLLPRVGAPVPWKIRAYLEPAPLLLSDCVISLECNTAAEAQDLSARIRHGWDSFSRVWTGSCAPYATNARLVEALAAIGVDVEIAR